MGFRRIGVFTRSGMEHPAHPDPVIPFPQLDKTFVADILRRAAE